MQRLNLEIPIGMAHRVLQSLINDLSVVVRRNKHKDQQMRRFSIGLLTVVALFIASANTANAAGWGHHGGQGGYGQGGYGHGGYGHGGYGHGGYGHSGYGHSGYGHGGYGYGGYQHGGGYGGNGNAGQYHHPGISIRW